MQIIEKANYLEADFRGKLLFKEVGGYFFWGFILHPCDSILDFEVIQNKTIISECLSPGARASVQGMV
jgi:hypothetical protein